MTPSDPAAPAPLLPGPRDAANGGTPGSTAELADAFDWAATPLGPREAWPAELRTAVGICLASRFPMCVWWGPELVLIYNDGYRESLGAEKHPHAFGRPGREAWPEIWDEVEPMLQGVMADGTAVWTEDREFVIRRGGQEETALFTYSLSPIPGEDGRALGVYNAVVETTGRVRAEQSLRRSEERYRVLVEGAQEYAMLMLDPGGVVTSWNSGAERIFGWPEAEALGRPGALIFTEEDRERGAPEAEMERAARDGVASDERWHVRRDGSRFWANGVLEALRDADGQLLGFAKVLRDETERREAERALQESERALAERNQQLEGLFQHAPAGMALFDAEPPYRVLAHNRVYQEFWPEPFQSEGMVGRQIPDYVPHVEESGILDVFREVAETGQGRTIFEFPYDGLERGRTWWNWTLSPVLTGGSVVAFAHMLLETTESVRARQALEAEMDERERTQRALRDSERRRRLALDAAKMGAWDIDEGSDEGRIDPVLAGLFGLPEGSTRMAVPYLLSIVHPDDREPLQRAVAEAWERSSDYEAEFRVLTGGAERWVAARGRVVGEPGRRRMLGVNYDVTERRRTARALRTSETRFREMAETVPDVLFTATADGRVDYVSRQIEALSGVTFDDVAGTDLWPDLVHPDDRPRVRAEWVGAVRDRRQFEVRYRLRRPAGADGAPGGYCWVVVKARPVYDEAGALARWFGTITDVDALTVAEGEVRQLNETLEARVEERTAAARRHEARARELARALTLAEQEERRRIAYVLHDDLQQVLAGAQIAAALGNTDRLEAVLDDAIRLTRTLSHELAPPLLRVEDLEHLVEWLTDRADALYGLRVTADVRGAVSVPDEPVRVLLYQVLRELLFNVSKHAGTGRARVVAEREGATVRVVVEDDGVGFDVSELDAPQAGGLGLPSVRERLELVGGRLAVASVPGEGTRVTIEVPSGGDEEE